MLYRDNFIFVEYNGVSYPVGFTAEMREVAGHFDKDDIDSAEVYSLHTEYSYGKRKFDSKLLQSFPALCEANKDGVPQLWKSNDWAIEFANFIIALTSNNPHPKNIEIHPPFSDYCSLAEFSDRFKIFENIIHSVYPDASLLIENRSGAVYLGGKFIVSKALDIAKLCDVISRDNLKLGVVLDFPQLLTAEGIDTLKFNADKYHAAVNCLIPYREIIRGIHIWGKKKSTTGRWVAHSGDFDTYFGNNQETKDIFISGIEQICNDKSKRFFVPEVNSGERDLVKILYDLFGVKV